MYTIQRVRIQNSQFSCLGLRTKFTYRTAQANDVNSNDYNAPTNQTGNGGDKLEEKAQTVSYFKLYRFATKLEIFLIIIGVLMAIINAFVLPLVIIIYGEFTTILVERAYRVGTTSDTVLLPLFNGGQPLTNATIEENRDEIYKDSISYLILMTISAVIQFISGTIMVDIFNYTSLKQVTRIRIRFFQSVLRQDIAWHDGNSGENFGSRITEDIEKIREGISEKVCMCISLFAVFIISVVIAFLYGWKLTLVCIACVPVLITTSTLVAKFQSSLTTKELQSYSNAGSIAEEVLAGIRTVLAFGGEKKESERYDQKLIPAEVAGKRKGAWSGVGEGIMKFVFYASNALAFWYGVTLILDDRDKEDKEYTPAVLMITFFGILVGSDNIARMAPFIGTFAIARGAATQIFKVIDREPKIDAMSKDGKIINYGIKGDVEFRNVSFRYPTRNDVEVLKNFNLKINAGQMIALVGASGCGKSTTIQLLQRFYDPTDGSVSIDGNDVRKLNISWLRANLAVVGQEPVLFATTIAENIRYGKPNATEQEIEAAARASSAHEFIRKLPNGYDTKVGERGALMSGGQKQRIAIARALIQNPKILLLDEATSALDSHSEKLVQDALDNASKGRTTIIISHRLSTIRQADRIVLLEKGKIVEDGTHDELMLLKRQYFHMNQVHAVENFDGNKEIDNAFDEMLEKEMGQSDKTVSKKDEYYHENHFQKQNGHLNCDQYNKELEELDDDNMNYFKLVCRIISYVKPEIPFLILGAIGALLAGASYPAFAILFGDIYGALSLHNPADVLDRTNILCICFLAVGIITAFSLFLQNYLFTLTGCHLTTRIRSLLFSSMIKQEMGWFDQENNSVGALCTKLSLDAPGIQAAIGQPLAGIFQAISTLIFGLAIAFYYSWKLALVCVSFIPLILGTVLFEAKFMSAAGFAEKTAIENATSIAMEAVSHLRTVASLRQESPMIHRYTESVGVVEKLIRKKMMFRGVVFSVGQAMPFFAYGVVLFYGGFLVADDSVPYQNIIKVSEGLIFGAMMLGQTLAFAPAFVSAFVAAQRIFRIVDRKPRIKSPFMIDNIRKGSNENNVNYQNVEFAYPKRPDVQILQGLNLEVLSGKTVALVGHSGCGKSTCIQLLQRLYDPDNGRIFVDVDEISNGLVLDELRSKLGIVSQEPVLFERTIAENIAYGDNNRNVHLADVIEAAKTANIHNFIMSLPLSYDTCLGTKGTSLSGGQKQRIAIARALVRNPKILLLDEATSALDSQSEKIVQQALEVARCGRTCIIIAHRLTTIQNADVICVLQNGKVVEMGNHESLLAKGGFYYKLYKTQSGNFE